MPEELKAFITSASLHSALAAIISPDNCSEWDRNSLLECTYLFMHSNVRLLPGPGYFAGAAGPFRAILSRFPDLHQESWNRDIPNEQTDAWLVEKPEDLRTAWGVLRECPQFEQWCAREKELFWEAHVQMHGCLFGGSYIPAIARVLGCSEKELRRLHDSTSNPERLKGFTRSRLATEAWLIAALIRGKYHEFLADYAKIQLIPHPFRAAIGKKLASGQSKELSNSEQVFTKFIVASALSERGTKRKLRLWINNVQKARQAFANGRIALQPALTIDDAETVAHGAAKQAEITAHSELWSRLLDVGVSAGGEIAIQTGISLMSVSVAPWVPIAGALLSAGATAAFRYKTGRDIGDAISSKTLTQKRFKSLIGKVPGRIERTFH